MSPARVAAWQRVEQAAFWRDDHTPEGFHAAVLQKFMHQVKRKARGLRVERHLMPVITGEQGGGKSTFVESSLAPLSDAVLRVDFDQISDDRIIDIWRSPVLLLDEMGGAKRADMETVKAAITSPTLARRLSDTATTAWPNSYATTPACDASLNSPSAA